MNIKKYLLLFFILFFIQIPIISYANRFPSLWEYLVLISIYSSGIGFIVSTIITTIIALINGKKWLFEKYLFLWIKIIGIIVLIPIIYFLIISIYYKIRSKNRKYINKER